MEKEKALNLIRRYKGNWIDEVQEAIETLIPELAESEDERIRKVIYQLMLGMREEIFTSQDEIVTKEKVLAYLEKQKYNRLQPIYDNQESFESALDKAWKSYNDSGARTVDSCEDDYVECAHAKGFREGYLFGLEKQKEQIPYTDIVIKPHKGDDNNPYDMRVSEAQEYAIKRGFGIPFNDGEVYVDERHIIQTIGNILRWADEHPKEQKPAEWSEEDERSHFVMQVLSDGHMKKAIEIYQDECDCKAGDVVKAIIRKKD